eukprot:g26466.t1
MQLRLAAAGESQYKQLTMASAMLPTSYIGNGPGLGVLATSAFLPLSAGSERRDFNTMNHDDGSVIVKMLRGSGTGHPPRDSNGHREANT